jgi:hypothetical protein
VGSGGGVVVQYDSVEVMGKIVVCLRIGVTTKAISHPYYLTLCVGSCVGRER